MKKVIWIKVVLFSVVLCIAPFAVASAQEAQPNPDDFGGKFSLGPALGGGGIIGFPLRYYATQKTIFELGPYVRLMSDSFGDSIMVSGGIVYYFSKKYIGHKQKCKSNGIFLKGGASFGDPPTIFFTAGWAHESFRLKNPRISFNMELGGRVMEAGYITAAVSIIYLKFSWTWFVGSTWK